MKAQAWRDLVYLYQCGTDSEWHTIYVALREARGLALLTEALEPALSIETITAHGGRLWRFVGVQSEPRFI